jgi:16S rRNA (cytosine1407-C5)-methyltransferase
MSKRPGHKLEAKRSVIVHRTAQVLNVSEEEAIRALSIGRQQGLRINTLRLSKENALHELTGIGWVGNVYDWCDEGVSIDSDTRSLGDSKLAQEGSVYIQNAASWLPVLALDPRPGDQILDICAAPGGKTSHIAARAQNQAQITANDNSRPRLAKLRANLERLGVQNIEYTLFDAAYLAKKLEGMQFNKILLDAPCSGEGMMRYQSDKDMSTWSVAHIRRLQQLQKRIITQAWQLLAPGGVLVYSTCTMAPEENEAVVDYLLRKQDDAVLQAVETPIPNRIKAVAQWNDKAFSPQINKVMRLAPSPNIEAFFVAKFIKQL